MYGSYASPLAQTSIVSDRAGVREIFDRRQRARGPAADSTSRMRERGTWRGPSLGSPDGSAARLETVRLRSAAPYISSRKSSLSRGGTCDQATLLPRPPLSPDSISF
jgi:hypothetical protein